MKKRIAQLTVGLLVTLLAGCGNLSFGSDKSSQGTATTTDYQTTGGVSSAMYQGVIENGRYKTSSARGLTLNQSTQTGAYNLKSMESGLLNLAKSQYKPDSYVFQEGQLLTTSTTREWLGRESKDNPNGLNPKDNGKLEPDKRNPMYLQSLIEQDFMVRDGQKLKLGGIAIALGLNEYDYYTKVKYGAQFTTKIPEAKMIEAGKAMAQTVVARLRKLDGVSKDTPILIALYQNSAQDSLVGGTFKATALSKASDKLGEWTAIDEANEVLPTIENRAPLDQTVATDFDNFKAKVETFFPTLAGVTAQAHYNQKRLQGLNVLITTQFYGESEIMSFTQYVAAMARKYLPAGVKLEITITATTGTQAFIAREAGQKGLYTHVFGSY